MLYDLNTWDLYGQRYTHRMADPITWIYIKPWFFNLWWRGGTYTLSYNSMTSDVEYELSRVKEYLRESGMEVKTKSWQSSIMMEPDRYRVSFYFTIHFRRASDCMQFKLAFLGSDS